MYTWIVCVTLLRGILYQNNVTFCNIITVSNMEDIWQSRFVTYPVMWRFLSQKSHFVTSRLTYRRFVTVSSSVTVTVCQLLLCSWLFVALSIIASLYLICFIVVFLSGQHRLQFLTCSRFPRPFNLCNMCPRAIVSAGRIDEMSWAEFCILCHHRTSFGNWSNKSNWLD